VFDLTRPTPLCPYSPLTVYIMTIEPHPRIDDVDADDEGAEFFHFNKVLDIRNSPKDVIHNFPERDFVPDDKKKLLIRAVHELAAAALREGKGTVPSYAMDRLFEDVLGAQYKREEDIDDDGDHRDSDIDE
jgi:hypothetical protein